jgi:hypothetical protein
MLQLHGTRANISREGIQTVWVQWYVDDYKDISSVSNDFGNSMGGNKLLLVNINAQQAEEGEQFIVTAQYEGVAESGLVQKSYAWQPEESAQPLITNPNIKELWTRYQATWDDDAQSIKWPRTLPGKKGKEIDNPMVGIESWLDLYGTWTETEVLAEIEADILDGVWSLVDQVPGGFPTPKDRLWLVLPPDIAQRGAAYEIRRKWRLTGVMTPEQLEATRLIYKPIQ